MVYIFQVSIYSSCWFHKGYECNLDSKNLFGAKEKLYGSEFFGKGGYYATTVGRDKKVMRDYIKHQEEEHRRIDQLDLF